MLRWSEGEFINNISHYMNLRLTDIFLVVTRLSKRTDNGEYILVTFVQGGISLYKQLPSIIRNKHMTKRFGISFLDELRVYDLL